MRHLTAPGLALSVVLATIAPGCSSNSPDGYDISAVTSRAESTVQPRSVSQSHRNVSVIYVGDFGDNSIHLFSQKSHALVGQIKRGILQPYGLTTDSSGNLYVVNVNPQNITVYAPAAQRPSRMLTTTDVPIDVAVAKNGTVYVATRSEVNVYLKEASRPTYTVKDYTWPRITAVGVDNGGHLYVGVTDPRNPIVELPATAKHGPGTKLKLKGLESASCIIFDKNANLVVADPQAGVIAGYKPGSSLPFMVISGNGNLYIALDSANANLYAASFQKSSVNTYAYPAGTAEGSFGNGLIQASGIALSPEVQ